MEAGRGAEGDLGAAEGAFDEHVVPVLAGVLERELHPPGGGGRGDGGHGERILVDEPLVVGVEGAEVVADDRGHGDSTVETQRAIATVGLPGAGLPADADPERIRRRARTGEDARDDQVIEAGVDPRLVDGHASLSRSNSARRASVVRVIASRSSGLTASMVSMRARSSRR